MGISGWRWLDLRTGQKIAWIMFAFFSFLGVWPVFFFLGLSNLALWNQLINNVGSPYPQQDWFVASMFFGEMAIVISGVFWIGMTKSR